LVLVLEIEALHPFAAAAAVVILVGLCEVISNVE
jgi:hypothetical protein